MVTLYSKEEKGIIYWINTGLAKVFDKEKALEWLRTCETHNRHSAVQELEDATKVVKNFENPTVESIKSSGGLRFRSGNYASLQGVDRKIAAGVVDAMNAQARYDRSTVKRVADL